MLFCATLFGQEIYYLNKYYPIAHQNEWRYKAPDGWKDGDYISKIEEVREGFAELFKGVQGEDGNDLFQIPKNSKTYRHYDATKASKLLSVNDNGILYHGETFSSDGSIAVFDKHIPWFGAEMKIGDSLEVSRNYIRYYKDGAEQKGVFTLTQVVRRTEDIAVPAGDFKNCLRVEFNTYWDLGKGMEAKSENVYHHAKNVGVVKASARFIILKNGIEIVNRLVEAQLKSFLPTGGQKVIKIQPFVNMKRIKVASVVTQDIRATKELYVKWLDYQVVEEGKVSKAMACNWGTVEMTGKAYALLQSKSGDDVYIRIIAGTVPKEYRAMTTYGWNAIEIIVENPDTIYKKLIHSPFTHLGGPSYLGVEGTSSIKAVQFKGPSEEVFYFTTDTGDLTTSSLLAPRVPIDRPFIMVAAGPDVPKMIEFYKNTFGVQETLYFEIPIGLIAAAQNLNPQHKFPLGLIRLGAFSNAIEIDGYPNAIVPRVTAPRELPPGVSIASFSVAKLNDIDASLFIAPPTILSGKAYQGKRVATIIGPVGELIELIEENKQ